MSHFFYLSATRYRQKERPENNVHSPLRRNTDRVFPVGFDFSLKTSQGGNEDGSIKEGSACRGAAFEILLVSGCWKFADGAVLVGRGVESWKFFCLPSIFSVVFCFSSFSRCAGAILHGVNALTRREMAVAVCQTPRNHMECLRWRHLLQ